MAIRAYVGEYDHRVTICKNEPTTNDDGQQVLNETDWIQRWASVRPVSGTERFGPQQVQADVTYRVRMHSDTQTRAITPEMWLKLKDGTQLNIKRVVDLEGRKMEMEMECNERVN
jgi:SPP1 family predicted phage head-tail adaptor